MGDSNLIQQEKRYAYLLEPRDNLDDIGVGIDVRFVKNALDASLISLRILNPNLVVLPYTANPYVWMACKTLNLPIYIISNDMDLEKIIKKYKHDISITVIIDYPFGKVDLIKAKNIKSMCELNGAYCIEDNSTSVGCETGRIGDIVIHDFKKICAISSLHYSMLRSVEILRNMGQESKNRYSLIGYDSYPESYLALPIDEWNLSVLKINTNQNIYSTYSSELKCDIGSPQYHSFPYKIKNAMELQAFLKTKSIICDVPVLMYNQHLFHNVDINKDRQPEKEDIILLPMDNSFSQVINYIKEFNNNFYDKCKTI